MSQTRLFQAIPLKPHAVVRLDENASHHLGKVLRAKVGDSVVLFNGEGGEYLATIQQIDKKTVTVQIGEFTDRHSESPLNICLVQGISRGEKMDFTIQKAVELGVKRVVPLLTERCNVKLDADRMLKKIEHWQAVATSAAEQSGRTFVPKVEAAVSLAQWIKLDQSSIKFALLPAAPQTLSTHTIQPNSNISLVIGPEGGLSEVEINQLLSAGFKPLNLGPRILRTETAGLAAISVIQSHFGDMK